MSHIFDTSPLPTQSKLDNFEKYVRRQAISRFLARYELFKLAMPVKGSIVECGVFQGGGVMAWAKLSTALEPYALDRRIFGFDTFSGFPAISDKDEGKHANSAKRPQGFFTGDEVLSELTNCISEFDDNRFLNQFDKVELIRGDATQTIPAFLEKNPHLLISLLFIDFDIYEPTKSALTYLLPRMPKGAILAFDEINNPYWPGETLALLEAAGGSINSLEIKRFNFDPNIAYIVL